MRVCLIEEVFSLFWRTPKKYVYLKYSVDLGPCRDLNKILKREVFGYEPSKKSTFTLAELGSFVERAEQDGKGRQESLIALFSFYGLGRSTEIAELVKEDLLSTPNADGSVLFVLHRCAKSRHIRTTRVFVPAVGSFNTALQLQQHLAATPQKPRVWWTWRKNRFVEQHFGKIQISIIAKNIALFLGKDPAHHASHSFRRSGATAVVEGGGTKTS